MNPEIAIALISSGSSLIVAGASIYANNRVLGYKVDDLRKDVEKHNQLIERMVIVERDLKTNWTRVDELKSEVKELRGK